MDQLRVFNRDGIWIDQVRATVERAWMWSTETSAVFRVSVHDRKCHPYTLNYGNLVLVENSDGLPDWVGMIDARNFEQDAVVIGAFTAERFFKYRRGPRSLKLIGSAGEIFAQMIYYINSLEDTVLDVGEIESEAEGMEETLNPVILDQDLKRIVQRSGEGYRWRPVVDRGKLTIYGDWYPTFRLDTGLILHDGYNISGEHPVEESAPVNDVLAYGTGNNWTTRLTAIATDGDSQEEYGLRQVSRSVQTPSLATLEKGAEAWLNWYKTPKSSFPLQALNVGDTFARLDVGARAALTRLVGIGFSGDELGYESTSIIVKGMYYNPENGYVDLTL